MIVCALHVWRAHEGYKRGPDPLGSELHMTIWVLEIKAGPLIRANTCLDHQAILPALLCPYFKYFSETCFLMAETFLIF